MITAAREQEDRVAAAPKVPDPVFPPARRSSLPVQLQALKMFHHN